MTMTIEVDLPSDLARFRLPEAVDVRLQTLLDRQDSGQPLTTPERNEAEGLVSLAGWPRHRFGCLGDAGTRGIERRAYSQ